MPRFKVTSGLSLLGELQKAGMPVRNFTEIAHGKGLDIANVFHKAFINVDEAGTEAAAATGVVVKVVSAVDGRKSFVAEHPFLFLIRDTQTGSILFLGRVTDPSPI